MFRTVLARAPFDRSDLKAFVGERVDHLKTMARWTVVLTPMAVVVGSVCAAFLRALDQATALRFAHPDLLFGLPLAGLLVGLVYHWKGRSAEGGNNLIVEQIHEPGGGVPLRMAPLIVAATVITHLFGGSAGREGTAVQLGGSLASAFARLFRLKPEDVRILLMGGVAAGFGAVFGTPIAGAIFALEVLAVGRIQYSALVPCLAAAVIGDWACHAWGVRHALYHIAFETGSGSGFSINVLLLAKVIAASVAFGLASLVFSEANHALGGLFKRLIPFAPIRPVVGGLMIIALVYIFGTREYLGLGVWSPNPDDATIAGFFDGTHIRHWSWALKIVFTVITLSAGFKGGEVTPLFFIGAALGNALSGLLGAPTDLMAGLGFVAVFAGAANTPLACTLMGIELFGSTYTIYIAAACFIAYLASGHTGIYLSQRVATPKARTVNLDGATLRELRERRARVRAARPAKSETIVNTEEPTP